MRTNITTILLLSLLTLLTIKFAGAQVYDSEDSFNYYNSNDIYYVSANGLRVRSSPSDTGKVMGLLKLNEKVLLVSPDLLNDKYVEIQILDPATNILPSDRYYVVVEFLSKKPEDYKIFNGKYFVVVNVASETLRVYERQCMDNSCGHKMVMETEVVVGEDKNHPIAEKGKGRSLLGSYRVTGWTKFYQDSEGHYPSWYKEGYPMPPEIGKNDWKDWFKKKYMPVGENGKVNGTMRGAFGWYAAFLAPHAYGQWTHGTLGWGENKDEYIKKTKKFMINVVSDPRSSGCTRNNNEAIAFLRQIIETGTPLVKIYAREALLDPALRNYPLSPRRWDYILTKVAGQRADRTEVSRALGLSDYEVTAYWSALRSGGGAIIDPASKLNEILEVGTYDIDNQPTIIPFTERKKVLGKWRATGRNGNVYGLKNEEMSTGVFYIDTGLLSGYTHPTAVVEVSGFLDEVTPAWMDIRNIYRYR